MGIVSELATARLVAAGWDPKWPFIMEDLRRPGMVRAIQADPSLSAVDKKRILEFVPGGKRYNSLFETPMANPNFEWAGIKKARKKSLMKAEAGLRADARVVVRPEELDALTGLTERQLQPRKNLTARQIGALVRLRDPNSPLNQRLEAKGRAQQAMRAQAGLEQSSALRPTTPPRGKRPRPKSVYDVLEGPDLRQLDVPGAEAYLTWAGEHLDKLTDLQRVVNSTAPGSPAHSTAQANLTKMLTTPWGKVQSPAEAVQKIVEKGNEIARAAGVSEDELRARNFPIDNQLALKTKATQEREALLRKMGSTTESRTSRLGGRKPLISLTPKGKPETHIDAAEATPETKWAGKKSDLTTLASLRSTAPRPSDVDEAAAYIRDLRQGEVAGLPLTKLQAHLDKTTNWKSFFKNRETLAALQEKETNPKTQKVLRDMAYEYEKEWGPRLSGPEFLANRGKALVSAQKSIEKGRLSITKSQAVEALGNWEELSDDERRLVISKIDNSKRLNLTAEQQQVLQFHRRNLRETGFAPGELEAYERAAKMGADAAGLDPELGEAWRYHSGVADRSRKYDMAPKGALQTRPTRALDHAANPPEGYRPVKTVLQGADISPRNLASTLALKKIEKNRKARLSQERAAMGTPARQDLLTNVDLGDEAGLKETRIAQHQEEAGLKAQYQRERYGIGYGNDAVYESDRLKNLDTPVRLSRAAAHPDQVGRTPNQVPSPRESWAAGSRYKRVMGRKMRGTVAGFGLPLLAGLAGSLIGDRL